jgi:hypothetical protein
MFHSRIGPQAAFHQQQGKMVKASPTLAVKYKRLKALTVILDFQDDKGAKHGNQLKYSVNLENAKSVFRFRCPREGCLRGDFDLSEEIDKAVAKRRTTVTGEMPCRGRTITRDRCSNVLHYKLKLGY